MTKRFLIPSLLAAGFGNHDPLQAAITDATATSGDDPGNASLFQIFRQDHRVTLAQHRSHRSHRSHSSHRSSTGGYRAPVYTPPPVYSPPARPAQPTPPRSTAPQTLVSPPAPTGQVRATAPQGDALQILPGRSAQFAAIVRRVQLALMGQGFFEGPITGTVGPLTRAALRRFQTARRLAVTGTITPETLDALRVSSD